MRTLFATCIGLGAVLLAGTAAAAPAESTADAKPAEKDRGALVLGGKVGGLVAFSSLNPNARAALEVGYIFPWANRSFAFTADIGYAAPKSSGSQAGDPRVAGGTYNWHLTQQELTIMPTLLYRFTALGKIVPYAGIGPRIYLLQSTTRGDVNGTPMKETEERSTKVGLGVPIGVQYQLGPGALMAEVLLEYGPLDHTATGSSNTGAANLFLGYRFML